MNEELVVVWADQRGDRSLIGGIDRAEHTAPVFRTYTERDDQPLRARRRTPQQYEQAVKDRARELMRTGRPVRAVASALGVSPNTVKSWQFRGWR